MAITTNGKVSITNLQVGSSADLASIISDESGTGVLAFTNSPTLTSPTVSGLTLSDASIVIEGATADGFETTLTVTDPSADRTITFQDASGTVAYLADISAATGGSVTETGTQTLTNKTLTSPIIDGTGAVFEGATADGFETTLTVVDPTADRTITLPDATTTLVGTDTTQTLTNKTLTSPVLGGTSTSASGNIVVKPATNILEVQGDNSSVVGQIQLNCHVNSHGQKIASQPHSESATNKLTLPGGTTIGNSDAVLVSDTGTQTLSNKTLTAPKFADLGFIADANGNELIILDTVTSAVNEVTLANAATGNSPTITASGGDTNIGITLTPKGSGNVTATALVYTQTLNTPSFSTNAYTLALTDQGDILLASNGSTAGTISIPTNANAAFPIGTQITIVQTGSGQITINAVTSGTTTVQSTGATATAPKLRVQYSSATCVKTATDTWLVIGDIA